MNRTARTVLRGVALALLGALVGTSGARAADAGWDKVVAAAKSEGRLVLYSGAATPKTLEPIVASFQERYGVKVELLHGRPSEMRERVRAEQAASRIQGDLIMDGTVLNHPSYIASYVAHEDFPNLKRLVPPFVSDGIFLPVGIGRQTVLINTRLVKPADEPKSWQDLLDPKWKGKIISDDPRGPGSGIVVYDVLNETLGSAYIDKLLAQNLTLSSDISISERRTAQGEFALMLPFRAQSIPNLRGLPVKAMQAKEGDVYIVMALARVKAAPHPNAARLFMNHFLDTTVQKRLLEVPYGSVTGESDAHLSAELRAINTGKLLGASQPQGQVERRKAIGERFDAAARAMAASAKP